jgi:hypothetical protein
MRPRIPRTVIVLLIAAILGGCVAGPNELVGTVGPEGAPAGFWLGLWHGFIALVTFIVSLFREDVGIYEVHNSGVWYDLGFVLGAMSLFGGGGGGASRRSKR